MTGRSPSAPAYDSMGSSDHAAPATNNKQRWRLVMPVDGIDSKFRVESKTVRSDEGRVMTDVAAPEAWLDIDAYADATFWIDCNEVVRASPRVGKDRHGRLPRRKKKA
jgi:hypothetical protein